MKKKSRKDEQQYKLERKLFIRLDKITSQRVEKNEKIKISFLFKNCVNMKNEK